jgi:type II secretory pathway component GspD/PulD (secretin)
VSADKSTYVIEVTPHEDIDNQVFLDFVLRKVTKGKSTIIARPRIITLENQEAVVEEGDSATSDAKSVVLSVTPHL